MAQGFMGRAALVPANVTPALLLLHHGNEQEEKERKKLNHTIVGAEALILHKEWVKCMCVELLLFLKMCTTGSVPKSV